MIKKKLFIVTVLIINILVVSQMSWAAASANLTYLETSMPDRWYQYDYTASNTSTAGEKLADIALFYDEAKQLTWLTTPTGWINWESDGYYQSGFTEVYANSNLYYILAGNSLPGFGFKTNYQAGSLKFSAAFMNSSDGVSTYGGMSTGTTVVPEPVSAILFLSGVTTIAVRRYLKIKKTPA